MTSAQTNSPATVDILASTDIRDIEKFLYQEARFADENDYDSWEALWTDDAIYWVPGSDTDVDPLTKVSIIYDNRNRIATRLKQVRTGKRYAQAPPSHLRRLISNVEVLGTHESKVGDIDIEVGANVLVFESRTRGNELWGGRIIYRLRPTEDGFGLSYKKVVLVDHDKAVATLGFLI